MRPRPAGVHRPRHRGQPPPPRVTRLRRVLTTAARPTTRAGRPRLLETQDRAPINPPALRSGRRCHRPVGSRIRPHPRHQPLADRRRHVRAQPPERGGALRRHTELPHALAPKGPRAVGQRHLHRGQPRRREEAARPGAGRALRGRGAVARTAARGIRDDPGDRMVRAARRRGEAVPVRRRGERRRVHHRLAAVPRVDPRHEEARLPRPDRLRVLRAHRVGDKSLRPAVARPRVPGLSGQFRVLWREVPPFGCHSLVVPLRLRRPVLRGARRGRRAGFAGDRRCAGGARSRAPSRGLRHR
ncbi:hypothetical protein SGPA1_30770 [Streptomyces misionensis JCM 4497]